MYTFPQGATVVTRSIRPPRVVFIVNTVQQCNEFIQLCSLTWGGKYFCILPYDPIVGLSNEWKQVLRAYDPDSIVLGCALDDATKQFLAELVDEQNIQEAVSFQPSGTMLFGQSLQGALLAENGFEMRDHLSPALIPDIAADHPLWLYVIARYGYFDDNWAKTIYAQLGLSHSMSLDYLIPLARPSIGEDFIGFMTNGERAEQTVHLFRQKVPPHIDLRKPITLLNYTLTGLRYGISQRNFLEEREMLHHAQYILIVSSSMNIEDFCWFWNLRAQRHDSSRVVWVPIDIVEDNPKRVADLFPSHARVFLLSKTVDVKHLQALAQVIRSSFIVETKDLNRFYAHDFFLGIPTKQEVIFENGRTHVPVPHAKVIRYCTDRRYFYVDINIEEIRLPRLNVIEWGKHNSIFVFYRVSRTGLSFFLDANTIESNPYLQVELPTAWQMLETFADRAGYTVSVSDKGFIANKLLHLLGGMDRSWMISGQAIYMLLDQLSEVDQAKEFKRRLSRDITSILGTQHQEIVSQIMRVISNDRHERVYQNLNSIKTVLQFQRSKLLHKFISWMLRQRIIFRGEEIKCPVCNTKQWLHLDDINTQIRCSGCQQIIETPLGVDSTFWKYRLNALCARAYNTGVIPHLLTLSYYVNVIRPIRWIYEQIVGTFPGVLLTHQENQDVPFASIEIDVAWIEDGELSIGECKTNGSELSVKEVERYIAIAALLKCRRIVFAILDDITTISQEVIALIEHSQITIELLTQQELFNQFPGKEISVKRLRGKSVQQMFEENLERYSDLNQDIK